MSAQMSLSFLIFCMSIWLIACQPPDSTLSPPTITPAISISQTDSVITTPSSKGPTTKISTTENEILSESTSTGSTTKKATTTNSILASTQGPTENACKNTQCPNGELAFIPEERNECYCKCFQDLYLGQFCGVPNPCADESVCNKFGGESCLPDETNATAFHCERVDIDPSGKVFPDETITASIKIFLKADTTFVKTDFGDGVLNETRSRNKLLRLGSLGRSARAIGTNDDIASYIVPIYIEHSYKTPGKYNIRIIQVSVDLNETVNVVIPVQVLEFCLDPIVRLHNLAPDLNSSSSVSYNRDNEILIWATVNLSCGENVFASIERKGITFNFTIYNLTKDDYGGEIFQRAALEAVELPRLRNMNVESSFVRIKSYSLFYGKYKVAVRVQLILDVQTGDDEAKEHDYHAMAEGYFDLKSHKNVTAIIEGGSSRILKRTTHGNQKDVIILNGASKSFDYDYPNVKLRYEWSCQLEMNSTTVKDCDFPIIRNKPVLEISEKLQQSNVQYVFTLTVTSPISNEMGEKRIGIAEQRIIILDDNENEKVKYNYSIVCVRNCGMKPVPLSDIELMCSCHNCPNSPNAKHNWTIQLNEGLDAPYKRLASKHLLLEDSVYIVIPSAILIQYQKNHSNNEVINVACTRDDDAFGGANLTFQLHKLPVPANPLAASCDITPTTGIALKTQFRIKCDTEFLIDEDDSPPILFLNLFLKLRDKYPGRFGYIYYHEILGFETDTESTFLLPTGQIENDYRHRFTVLMQDIKYSSIIISNVSSPQVLPLKDENHFFSYFSPKPYHPWNIFNLVYGGNRDGVYRLVLSAINELSLPFNISGLNLTHVETAKLKFFMLQAINATSMVGLRDVEHMNSVVHAIVHHDIDNVFHENQTLSFTPFLANLIGYQLSMVVRRGTLSTTNGELSRKRTESHIAPHPNTLIRDILNIAMETSALLLKHLRSASEQTPAETLVRNHFHVVDEDPDSSHDELDRDYFEEEEVSFEFISHFGEDDVNVDLDAKRTTASIKNLFDAFNHYADTIGNELNLIQNVFNYEDPEILSFSVGVHLNHSILGVKLPYSESESLFSSNYFELAEHTQFLVNDTFASEVLQVTAIILLVNPYVDHIDEYAIITPLFEVIIKDYVNLNEVQAKPVHGDHRVVLHYLKNETLSSRVFKLHNQKTKSNVFEINTNFTGLAAEDLIVHQLLLPEQSTFFVALDDSKHLDLNAVMKEDFRPICSDFIDRIPKIVSNTSGQLIYQLHTEELKLETEKIEKEVHKDQHYHLHPILYFLALAPTPKSLQESKLVNATIAVNLSFSRIRCLTMRNALSEGWREGCIVNTDDENDDKSPIDKLICECRHLSLFAGSIRAVEHNLQKMNSIELFPGENEKTLIPWIVSGALILYALLLCLSAWLDYHRIILRPKVFIMANIRKFYAEQFYLISVQTGNSILASTSANVCCQLYGEKGRSKLYVLKDSNLDSTKSGDITNFLISSEKDLGKLEKLRVWHDNSGYYPGWYCRKIVIRNLKTDELWFFFIDGWLSVHGNGHNQKPLLICTSRIATNEQVEDFLQTKLTFREYWFRILDNHIWISFFTCAPFTIYPRIERLTSAMVMLSTIMLMLMTHYGFTHKEDKPTYEFRELSGHVGPTRGMLAGFLASFVGISIACLFRRIERNRVPALILNGENGVYERSEPLQEVLLAKSKSHKAKSTKSGFVFGFHPNKFVAKQQREQPVESMDDGIIEKQTETEDDDESVSIALAEPEKTSPLPKRESSTESVFRIPSTNIIQTENWVSRALTLYAKDRNPIHLVHRYNENGEEDSDEDELRPRASIFPVRTSTTAEEKLTQVYEPLATESLESIAKHEPTKEQSMKRKPMIESSLSPQTARVETTKAAQHLQQLNKEFRLVELPINVDHMFHLPFYCIFLVWFLAALIIIISSSFTIIYGFNYSYIRSIDWTISLFFAILSSCLIWEPLIALLIYFVEMYQIKKGKRMTKKELMTNGKFILIGTEDVKKRFKQIWRLKCQIYLDWMKNAFPPLTGSKIFSWKLDARRKLKARKGVVDVLVFFAYLLMVLHAMRVTRSRKNWQNTRIFEEMLLLSKEKHILENQHAFMNIHTPQEFYHYMDQIFAPAIHLDTDFSGNPQHIHHNRPDIWLSNRHALLLGVPRIRQFRVKPGSDECKRGEEIESFQYSCDDELTTRNIEKSDFSEGWLKTPIGMNRTFSPTNDLWKYRVDSTTSYGCSECGYVAELGRTKENTRSVIRYLKRNQWIDTFTREIFIEFTSFNPNVNLYNIAVLKLELTNTLAIVPSVELTSTRFMGGSSEENIKFTDTSFNLFFILFLFCCAYLLYNPIFAAIDNYKRDGVKGVYRDWVTIFDICMPAIGLAIIFNFLRLYILVAAKLDEIREKKMNSYFSFHDILDRNEAQVMLYCISMVLCLVKLWRLLLMSSRRFFIIGFTLSQTKNYVFGCILMYFFLLIAFSLFATINFGSINESHRTIVKSILVSIYQTGLGIAFNYKDWAEVEPVWGPVLYATFNIFVIFLFLNVLISTLTLGLQEAKEVSIQRPFRMSYTGYIWLKLQSFLPLAIKKIFVKKESIITISPEKERELEEAFIQILENHITSIEVQRIREMKEITEKLVASTGQKLVSKKDKMTAKKNKIQKVGEDRLNCMRELAIQFIKKTAKLEFNIEEKAQYDNFNKAVLKIKCNKLVGKMKQMDEKLQAHFSSYQQTAYFYN